MPLRSTGPRVPCCGEIATYTSNMKRGPPAVRHRFPLWGRVRIPTQAREQPSRIRETIGRGLDGAFWRLLLAPGRGDEEIMGVPWATTFLRHLTLSVSLWSGDRLFPWARPQNVSAWRTHPPADSLSAPGSASWLLRGPLRSTTPQVSNPPRSMHRLRVPRLALRPDSRPELLAGEQTVILVVASAYVAIPCDKFYSASLGSHTRSYGLPPLLASRRSVQSHSSDSELLIDRG